MMNGTLLGLMVVAAIGVVLWALLFIGNKLLDKILGRRTTGHDEWGISHAPQSAEEVLVDFVRHSPGLTGALNLVTTSTQPKQFAQLLHESGMDRAAPDRANVEAKATAAALLMLFVSGLIRVATDGLAVTELGREVQRGIDVARKRHERNTSLPLAVRRKGIARSAALHLDCARSA